MLSFKVTEEDAALIRRIAARASEEIARPGGPNKVRDVTSINLRVTIAQGCPLRLQELLDASMVEFAHDICGIHRFIDRKTGKLTDGFRPIFAA